MRARCCPVKLPRKLPGTKDAPKFNEGVLQSHGEAAANSGQRQKPISQIDLASQFLLRFGEKTQQKSGYQKKTTTHNDARRVQSREHRMF